MDLFGGGIGLVLGVNEIEVPVAVVLEELEDALRSRVNQVRPGLPKGVRDEVDEADLQNQSLEVSEYKDKSTLPLFILGRLAAAFLHKSIITVVSCEAELREV